MHRRERECYSLCGFKGQTKQPLGISRGQFAEFQSIASPNSRQFRNRVRDPGWLIPFPSERHRRQVG
jgi:hypothetical protein